MFIVGHRTHRYVKADNWPMALLNVPCRFMLGNLLHIPVFSIVFDYLLI